MTMHLPGHTSVENPLYARHCGSGIVRLCPGGTVSLSSKQNNMAPKEKDKPQVLEKLRRGKPSTEGCLGGFHQGMHKLALRSGRIWTGLEGEGDHPQKAKWYTGDKNTM